MSRRNTKWVLLSAVLLAAIITPIATGATTSTDVKGGGRNPSANPSSAYTSETQIISNNATYGTRQSNKGTGGGAIYGCRSGVGQPPCIRSSNLTLGQAFQFSTGGNLGGTITAVGGDAAKPFTTNATGVATGLNADRVDSLDASQISAAGAASAVATVQSGLNFVQVDSSGAKGSSRGVASVDPGTAGDGKYTVVFNGDISACALSATETTTDNGGAVAVSLGSDKKTVTVVTRAGGGDDGTGATAPADKPFNLQATCV